MGVSYSIDFMCTEFVHIDVIGYCLLLERNLLIELVTPGISFITCRISFSIGVKRFRCSDLAYFGAKSDFM